MDPTLQYKMRVIKLMTDLVKGDCSPGTHRNLVHTETRRDHEKNQKHRQTVANVDREHRDGCDSTTPSERIVTSTAIAKQSKSKMQREIL